MLMLDTKMDPPLAKSMICGAADPLRSAFHLSYRMLLALLRSQMVSPEAVLRASFRQFQTERALPQLQARTCSCFLLLWKCSFSFTGARVITVTQAKVDALQAQHDSIQVPDEAMTAQCGLLLQQLREHQAQLRPMLNAPVYALPFVQPGRLVRVATTEDGALGAGGRSCSTMPDHAHYTLHTTPCTHAQPQASQVCSSQPPRSISKTPSPPRACG